MQNNGWIKLHRCLLDKPIWSCSTIEQRVILITILCLANHDNKQWEWKGKKFTCQPGQFITSSGNLAKRSGVTRQNVRTALARFQNYEFLTYESTKTGMLVTLVNWGKYQDDTRPTNQDANQRVTNDQPTGNQQLTTNKNIKNNKKNKNIIYAENVSMTTEEYQKLVDEHGEPATKRMIEILDNYKGSTGKPYKNDYRAILNWVIKRYEEDQGKPKTKSIYDKV